MKVRIRPGLWSSTMYKNTLREWELLPKPTYWKSALVDIVKQPDVYKSVIYGMDRDCMAIYDRYPKAQRHLLIVPRSITPSIHELTTQHLPILRQVIQFAHSVADSLVQARSLQPGQYKFGFHAIPSLDQLHMHLISTDMQSECLKNRRHWNSFCTDFFLPPEFVLKQIEAKGKLEIDDKYFNGLLEKPLACHVCGQNAPNLPKLKSHIRLCCDLQPAR